MKILMASRYAKRIGGIESFLFDSSRILKRDGHSIFALFEEGELAQTEASIFEKHLTLPQDGATGNVLDQIASISPDMVMIHKICDIRLLRELNRRFKTLAVVHDHDYYCIRRHKYFPVNRKNCTRPFSLPFCSLCSTLLERSASGVKMINPFARMAMLSEIRRCGKYAVISEYMRENLISNSFDSNKIAKLKPPLRALSGEQTENKRCGAFRILFVGQLIRGKGADLLLHAAKLLKIDFELRIAGTGNDESFLKELCSELKLSSQVSFMGRATDIAPLYDWANISVLPSRWQEPFGLVGIESMSRGRPVVAFDIGGVREWLRDSWNGLLAKPGDVADLAAKIEELAGSEDMMRTFGANGLDTVRLDYSDQAFVSSFLNSIEDLK